MELLPSSQRGFSGPSEASLRQAGNPVPGPGRVWGSQGVRPEGMTDGTRLSFLREAEESTRGPSPCLALRGGGHCSHQRSLQKVQL